MRLPLYLLALTLSPSLAFVNVLGGSSVTLLNFARAQCAAANDGMSMAYNRVFVAGAGKGVGRIIVDKLVAQGSEVVALVRREDAKVELDAMKGVSAILTDAFDIKAVEGAMDGCDAAITTLGGAKDDEGHLVDYAGNRNVIESAGILGVTRVVLVTSLGCGSSREAITDEVYKILEAPLKAKTKAENMLLKYYTNGEWTIIRPGGLKSEPATGKAVLTESTTTGGVIHREDVADLAVKALNSKEAIRKVLTAVDPSIESQYSQSSEEVAEFAL